MFCAVKPKSATRSPDAVAAKISRGRIWLFRVVAFLLVPACAFAVAEIFLRLIRFGYPPEYFVAREIQGKEMLTENPRFGFRFFPPGLARSPLPTVISPEKESGAYRIFLFGESAALGDPRPAFGLGRYLEVLLNERFPSHRFEVVCVSMTAINSHVILPIARECAQLDGDLWIIYMGNNEMIGPFGATGKLGATVPSVPLVRANLAIQSTRIGQGLQAFIRYAKGGSQESTWRGLGLFTGHEIPPDSPLRQSVEENFRANLKSILAEANEANVRAIVCTVASSLLDCAPHASMHSGRFSADKAAQWKSLFSKGVSALEAGEFEEAESSLAETINLDPLHAEARFRLGMAHFGQSDVRTALDHFIAARDTDALPFRTTSSLNRVIREAVGDSSKELMLLDMESEFNSGEKIPGLDVFFDHVHFNFAGNYRAALRMAEIVQTQIPAEMKHADAGKWGSQDLCERTLALTTWNRYLAFETMLSRLSGPPYTNQITNADCRKEHLKQMRELREQARNEGQEHARQIYLAALERKPNDHYVHQNFAEFLELSGKTSEAIAQWEQVQKLVPHHPAAYFHAGRLNLQQGGFEAAEKNLRQALAIREDFPEAMVELGKALTGQGKHELAQVLLHDVLAMNSANAAAHYALAESLGAQGQQGEAMDHLRKVVEINPRHWEAHYYLGVELAVRGELRGASEHFEQVVRLRPENALGHLNYGVALARQRRFSEAALHFEETLRLNPNNEAASKHLEAIKELGFQGNAEPPQQ